MTNIWSLVCNLRQDFAKKVHSFRGVTHSSEVTYTPTVYSSDQRGHGFCNEAARRMLAL